MTGYWVEEPLEGPGFPVRFQYGPWAGEENTLVDVPPVVWTGEWEGDLFVRSRYTRARQADQDGTTRYIYAGTVDVVAVRESEA